MDLGIYGLGAVGSTLARHASSRGHRVRCVDIDESVVARVNEGTYFAVDLDERLSAATSGETVVPASDVVVVAVPTPLDTNYAVDLGAVRAASRDLAAALDLGGEPTLVVVESTVPPGTTETVVRPILEEAGATVGEDVHLATAPERIDPGNDEWPLGDIPRVVGAVTDEGRDRAVDVYETLLDAAVHPVESPAVAEAAKIIENAFRDVNIAFVNEIAVSLGELGIDAAAALDAAATKPFGFMRFSPGAGVGGDCIPVDPYLLIERAERAGFDHRFLKFAREVNEGMPEYVVDQTVRALNEAGILPNGASALLLGRSFKPGLRDDRNSPYHAIADGLSEYGVETSLYDPHWPDESVDGGPYVDADALVLVTDHDGFADLDFERYADLGVGVVVDGRNAFDPDEVTGAGLVYAGIGRGDGGRLDPVPSEGA